MLNHLKSPQFCCHKIFLFPIERNKKFDKAKPTENLPTGPKDGEKQTEKSLDEKKKEGCAVVEGQTRGDVKDLQGNLFQGNLDRVKAAKAENDKKIEEKKQAASQDRKEVPWKTNDPLNDTIATAGKGKLQAQIAERFKKKDIQDLLQQNGLNTNPNNINILREACYTILFDYLKKYRNIGAMEALQEQAATGQGQIGKELEKYGDEILGKVKHLLTELDKTHKKNIIFNNQLEVLEDFSSFTQLNFLKKGQFQPNELQAFLLLENYDNLIGLYGESLALRNQNRGLETEAKLINNARAEEAQKNGKKLDIAKMISDKDIPLPVIHIILPASGDIDQTLRDEIGKAIKDDDKLKPELVDYLFNKAKENKDLKANDILELKEDWTWEVTDGKKAAEEAAQAAAAESPQTGAGGALETPLGNIVLPAWIPDWAKGFIESIIKAIQGFLALFGIKGLMGGGASPENGAANLTDVQGIDFSKVKDWENWKKLPDSEKMKPEEETGISGFINAMVKTKSNINMVNIKNILVDPEQTRRILKNKPDQTSWEDYINERIDTAKEVNLKTKEPGLKAKDAADLFLTPATKTPAAPTPETPPAPN